MPGAHSFSQPYVTVEYLNQFTCAGCMVRTYVIQETIADLSAGHSVVRMYMYCSTLCFQSYNNEIVEFTHMYI